MGRRRHPSEGGGDDEEQEPGIRGGTEVPEGFPSDVEQESDEDEPLLPDIRVVTLAVNVDSEDDAGEVRVHMDGVGYYEGLGMIVSALFQCVQDPFSVYGYDDRE